MTVGIERTVGTLNVDAVTSAPLRVIKTARLNAPQVEVFAVIADHVGLSAWFSLIEQAQVDHSNAAVEGGDGTVRYCTVQGGTVLKETIVGFDRPHIRSPASHRDADTARWEFTRSTTESAVLLRSHSRRISIQKGTSAMTTVSATIRIDAPRERVWEIVADLGTVATFHPYVTHSYYSSEAKAGPGARAGCVNWGRR
jgi:uncharacterized protein YndB with AHSA1/START domain